MAAGVLFSLLRHDYRSLVAVGLVTLFSVPFIIKLVERPRFQVCYGTGEEIRGLLVKIHCPVKEITGKHVMLCRFGGSSQKYHYSVYLTEDLEMQN